MGANLIRVFRDIESWNLIQTLSEVFSQKLKVRNGCELEIFSANHKYTHYTKMEAWGYISASFAFRTLPNRQNNFYTKPVNIEQFKEET